MTTVSPVRQVRGEDVVKDGGKLVARLIASECPRGRMCVCAHTCCDSIALSWPLHQLLAGMGLVQLAPWERGVEDGKRTKHTSYCFRAPSWPHARLRAYLLQFESAVVAVVFV